MSDTPSDNDDHDHLTGDLENLATPHNTTTWKVLGEIDAPDGTGVLGHNTATSGVSYGVEGVTDSADADAAGVIGGATQESGETYGVHGVTRSDDNMAWGVFGHAPRGNADGVVGIANQGGFGVGGLTTVPTHPGVKARNTSTTGSANAIVGLTDSSGDGSTGVFGKTVQASGKTYGVKGESPSTASNAAGVYGRSTTSGATAHAHGVFGVTEANADPGNGQFPSGVRGEAAGSGGVIGVTGFNANDPDGIGVAGAGLVGTGVFGRAFSGADDTKAIEGWASAGSGRTYGVHGRTDSSEQGSAGVRGRATQGSGHTFGVVGSTESKDAFATGVKGEAGTSGVVQWARGVAGFSRADADLGSNTFTFGVIGQATGTGGTTGVLGNNQNDPDGWGVFGRALEGTGVEGSGNAGTDGTTGVRGKAWAESGRTYGVVGQTESSDAGAAGVRGEPLQASGQTYGVEGVSTSPSGYAVYADGDSKTVGDHEVTGSQSIGEVGASVYLANNQTVSPSTNEIVVFDGEIADDRNEYDPNTGTLTAASDGAYHVSLQLVWSGGLPADTTHRVSLLVNSNNHTDRSFNVPDSSTEFVMPALSRTLRLSAGDNVEVEVFQNSSSSQDLARGEQDTWMTIDKIG